MLYHPCHAHDLRPRNVTSIAQRRCAGEGDGMVKRENDRVWAGSQRALTPFLFDAFLAELHSISVFRAQHVHPSKGRKGGRTMSVALLYPMSLRCHVRRADHGRSGAALDSGGPGDRVLVRI